MSENDQGKIERLIHEKSLEFNEKNEEENQKIELNLLVLGAILKKSCESSKCLSRKNLLI